MARARAPSQSTPRQLSSDDLAWLARKIHEHRPDLETHPRWARRIELAIDDLLWSASVDGVSDADEIVQDGWVKPGQGLRAEHFGNVPHTAEAWAAYEAGDLTSIKREHIVPRSKLRAIVLRTTSPEDTTRVLAAYARVALVHELECARLLPQSDMPTDWDATTDWARLPAQLPGLWTRYERADPPVIPLFCGVPVFTT